MFLQVYIYQVKDDKICEDDKNSQVSVILISIIDWYMVFVVDFNLENNDRIKILNFKRVSR